MKLIRVVNISNRAVTIHDTVIEAHKIKDFPEDILSKDDLEDIASYSAVGVIRAFEYIIQDGGDCCASHSNEEDSTEETASPKRNRRK